MQRYLYRIGREPIGSVSAVRTRLASTQARRVEANSEASTEISNSDAKQNMLRSPRSAQLIHLKPLRRTATHGLPSCNLQLRSFSLQPLEIFSDFALRAAYYLGLPAHGPVPLPRITERWTVPKSHFIFKKAQENFERITLRRMIQIQDGNPETVQLWLAYLRKHQYYGIGMKANFWEFGSAEQNTTPPSYEGELQTTWAHLGQTKGLNPEEDITSVLESRRQAEANAMRHIK